ncbi:MAG: hypothetical protein PHU75_00925 [Candidatus Nanopelagicales bacterium]|nr:hypothetical protein [Candidatus Nanopelagicales bacterium]
MDYLDAHAGSLQLISSLVLVFITGWYALLTRNMARSALESRRPYAFIDFRAEGTGRAELVIGNDGERAAQGITITATVVGSAELAAEVQAVTGIANGVSYLAPGRRYRYQVLLPREEVFDRPDGDHVALTFDLAYSGEGRRYSESFTINMTSLRGVLFASFTDPGEAIASSIKELANIERSRVSSNRMDGLFRSRKKACPACASQIPLVAKKCPECLEWIPDQPSSDTE